MHNIKFVRGLKSQFIYTKYAVSKFPHMIFIYLFVLTILGVTPFIGIWMQREIVSTVQYATPFVRIPGRFVLMVVFFFLASASSHLQEFFSPLAQYVMGAQIAWKGLHDLHKSLQSLPLTFFDNASNLAKVDNAKIAINSVVSAPAILFYNIGYFAVWFISIIITIQYSVVYALICLVSGLLASVVKLYGISTEASLSKHQAKDMRRIEYLKNLMQERESIPELRIHQYNDKLTARLNSCYDNVISQRMALLLKNGAVVVAAQALGHGLFFAQIALLVSMVLSGSIGLPAYVLLVGNGKLIIDYTTYIFNAINKAEEYGVYLDDLGRVPTIKIT